MSATAVEFSDYSASLQPKRDLAYYKKRLAGMVDFQLHIAPDVVKRSTDDLDYMKLAVKVGLGGFVLKDHHVISAGRALLLNKEGGTARAFGGVVLNSAVGGPNPFAVESAIQLGACQVWLPTFDARNHIEYFKDSSLPELKKIKGARAPENRGIYLLDEEGNPVSGVTESLGLMADADVILGTGHVSLAETYAIVKRARREGVKKILITHPRARATNWETDDHVKLVEMGAWLEHVPSAHYDPKLISESIRAVGAGKCILSSDSGQLHNGHPFDAFLGFIDSLMAEGITEDEVQTMTVRNPSRLLGLE